MTEDMDFERRFGGVARLYGQAALERFQRSHVAIVGVGGVGSWVVEGLARSALGALTLIDLDQVAESNINRQVQALSNTVGQAKVEALAARVALINPSCRVQCVEEFVTPENVAALLPPGRFDCVVDAMDSVKDKTALIAHCQRIGMPLLTVGAAGGQRDPGMIQIRDLARTEQEPLLALVRKRLRQRHAFPRGAKSKFGIDAIFSMEAICLPEQAQCVAEDAGAVGVTGLNCAGFGSSVMVTASFGLRAAAWVLERL